MMKPIHFVVLLMICIFSILPIEANGMGWMEPVTDSGGSSDPGPVSAPEPGAITLIAMAVSGGVGYYLGKRKK